MNSVIKFNGLSGQITSRDLLVEIMTQAFDEQQFDVHKRILKLLDSYPEAKSFELEIDVPALFDVKAHDVQKSLSAPKKPKTVIKKTKSVNSGKKLNYPEVSKSMLAGIPYLNLREDHEALGKPVSPEQIYDMITQKIIEAIKENKNLFWRKTWQSEEYGIAATNYISKKPYRGINAILLNFIAPLVRKKPIENPYWLTFKQVERLKGKVKKGSRGYEVIYYAYIYKIEQVQPQISYTTPDPKKFQDFINANKSRINSTAKVGKIPVLKYYKVFSADDVEGIKFKMPAIRNPKEIERIAVAESIVENMPNAPKLILEDKGDSAHYIPKIDSVTMPKLSFFEGAQEYYSTFFHELIHSTGNPKRLNRDLKGNFGSKSYAFEELIAELGAVFLCGESGILYHTLNNSAAYIKGWRKKLLDELTEDNKFIFRAASASQMAADYILDRDKKGVPKYLANLKKVSTPKAATKKAKPTKNDAQLALFGKSTTKKSIKKKKVIKQLGTVMIDMNPPASTIVPMAVIEPLVIEAVRQPVEDEIVKQAEKPKLSRPSNPYVQNVKDTKEIANNANYFDLHGAFIDFTGRLEQKTDGSLVITLDAPPGAGKTRSVFQFLNIAANSGMPSIFASLEEHPTSKIFHDKRELYITPDNEDYIDTIGELPPTYEEFMKLIEPYQIIAIDSWNKVFETYKGIDFDRDLRKALNGKIIVTIFQRTGSGQMRGGSKAGFDGDIILEIVKTDDYRDSYVIARKNRYQQTPLNEIGYNFFHQKTINPEIEGENAMPNIPNEIMV